MRELLASRGYKSYDGPVVHFGLGQYEKIDKVVVMGSTGEETVVETPLKSGTIHTIKRLNPTK